jgi:flagellar motility protein MotE (MotC chaperone)
MSKHIRLLPAVMAMGAALLLVKAVGLVHEARAQAAAAPSAPAQSASALAPAAFAPPISAARSGSDSEDAETSSSEVDVLTSLSKRRAALDARERALETQQDLIVAAEKRIDDKIASLKTLQSQIKTLLAERDVVQQKQLDSLVKTYSSMKPRDAARIFNNLDEAVLVSVASQLKPDVLAAILGQMQSEPAQKLTVKLADRLKLADPPAAAAPVPAPPQALQTASAQPAPAQAPAPVVASPIPAPIQATVPAPAPPAKVASAAPATPATAGK